MVLEPEAVPRVSGRASDILNLMGFIAHGSEDRTLLGTGESMRGCPDLLFLKGSDRPLLSTLSP